MIIPKYKPIDKQEGIWNLSPSSLGIYYDNPKQWHKNQVLKESTFKGSTNSVFGSIIHAVAEAHFLGDVVTLDDVELYLQDYSEVQEVDNWHILENFIETRDCLVEWLDTQPKPDEVEGQAVFSPVAGYSIGGSYDAIIGTTLRDYKTVSQFATSIKPQHKAQLIMYSLALQATRGVKIDKLQIVQIKRGDSVGYPSEKTGKMIGKKKPEVRVIEETLSKEMIEEYKDDIKILFKCLDRCKDDDTLTELIFRRNPISYMVG